MVFPLQHWVAKIRCTRVCDTKFLSSLIPTIVGLLGRHGGTNKEAESSYPNIFAT